MRERFSGRVGVIQGRLSARPSDRLQAFPRQSWQQEFDRAAEIGFECIEWIYEAPGAEHNPIRSAQGRRCIRDVISATGVAVSSICGDYFMVNKLAGEPAADLARNVEVLEQVIVWAAELGAKRILLPLLETSQVDTAALQDDIVRSLAIAARTAERAGIVLGLEMEIPGQQYLGLVQRVAHPLVRVYYDTGNSTAQGIDIGTDVRDVLPALEAVHVKDRKTFGTSQPLGCGDANFEVFFSVLAKQGFSGDFVLQHYFSNDPIAEAARSRAFIEECMARATREAA